MKPLQFGEIVTEMKDLNEGGSGIIGVTAKWNNFHSLEESLSSHAWRD
jgi:hypothetical protein